MAKKVFHRLTRNDGKIEWIKSMGDEVNIEGYKFFYVMKVEKHSSTEGDVTNYLIEEQTGLSVADGKSKNACVNHFKEQIEKHGKDKFEELIKNSIERYGQSPSYNRVTYNPVVQ